MIDKLETLALKSVLLKDSEYFYRKICRYYSEKFHTPLTEVHKLPWPFVFTNYMEHIIEKNYSEENLNELAIDICYPELRDNEEKELQTWIKRVEEEEEEKRTKKKELIKKLKAEREIPENPHIEEESINMGSSSFEHLDKEMSDDDE